MNEKKWYFDSIAAKTYYHALDFHITTTTQMDTFPTPEHGRVRRVPKRAHYDEPTVHAILDAAYIAHVGFSMDGRPFVIPMLHGRVGNTLFLHASTKSRIYTALSDGQPVCVTVTLLDGIVLARSAFHHSMNYRSVVAHGACRPLSTDEREQALYAFTDKLIPGRWDECRPVLPKEIDVTGVLAFDIATAAAKIRTGGPVDDEADYALPIWAGVVPLSTAFGAPIPDENRQADVPVPPSVEALYKG